MSTFYNFSEANITAEAACQHAEITVQMWQSLLVVYLLVSVVLLFRVVMLARLFARENLFILMAKNYFIKRRTQVICLLILGCTFMVSFTIWEIYDQEQFKRMIESGECEQSFNRYFEVARKQRTFSEVLQNSFYPSVITLALCVVNLLWFNIVESVTMLKIPLHYVILYVIMGMSIVFRAISVIMYNIGYPRVAMSLGILTSFVLLLYLSTFSKIYGNLFAKALGSVPQKKQEGVTKTKDLVHFISRFSQVSFGLALITGAFVGLFASLGERIHPNTLLLVPPLRFINYMMWAWAVWSIDRYFRISESDTSFWRSTTGSRRIMPAISGSTSPGVADIPASAVAGASISSG